MDTLAKDTERGAGVRPPTGRVANTQRWLNVTLVLLFIFGPMIWVLATFNVMSKRTANTNAQCSGHLNLLAIAFKSYAHDHDGRLPNAATWVDDLSRYIKSDLDKQSAFHCPSDRTTRRSSYAMNRNLSGKRFQDLANPANTVLLYETNQDGLNPTGTGKDVVNVGNIDSGLGRHNTVAYRFNYYLFADFQVRYPKGPEQEKQYQWDNSRSSSASR